MTGRESPETTRPAGRPLNFLFLSHTAPNETLQVGSHFYAKQLAALGHYVLHMNSPTSVLHRVLQRESVNGAAATQFGLFTQVTPTLAFSAPRTLLPIGGAARLELRLCHVPRALARWRRHPDVVLIDECRLHGVLARPGVPTVYRPTDIATARGAARAEAKTVTDAAAVVATSSYVLDSLCATGQNIPSLVLPNGVDAARFYQGELAAQSGRPLTAVYVGSLDERFDWSAVITFATASPDMQFNIYGPPDGLLRWLPPNVSVLGPASYNAVPEILARSDVGLMPFVPNHENEGRSPMKLYEYLCAGLPVVASRTAALRALDPPGVLLYDRPEEVGGLLPELARSPNTAGREAATQMDWALQAQKLLDFVAYVLSLPHRPPQSSADGGR